MSQREYWVSIPKSTETETQQLTTEEAAETKQQYVNITFMNTLLLNYDISSVDCELFLCLAYVVFHSECHVQDTSLADPVQQYQHVRCKLQVSNNN